MIPSIIDSIVAKTSCSAATAKVLADGHLELAESTTITPVIAAAHRRWASAYMRRAGKPAEDAEPGDPCGLILGDGAICDGTLECWTDVRGGVPGCSCHISPPCGACLEAPLVCGTCNQTMP